MLVKYRHKVARLGVWLVDSTSGGVLVHPSCESSLVVEVKEGQHLDSLFMELKDSVLVKMNESFALGDDDILRYYNWLCVQDVDDFEDQNHYRGPWFQIFHISRFHQDVS